MLALIPPLALYSRSGSNILLTSYGNCAHHAHSSVFEFCQIPLTDAATMEDCTLVELVATVDTCILIHEYSNVTIVAGGHSDSDSDSDEEEEEAEQPQVEDEVREFTPNRVPGIRQEYVQAEQSFRVQK